ELLVADRLRRDQPHLRQPGQLPVHAAGARTGQADQLGALVAALRLAEQQAQHPLLDRGEQHVGQRGGRSGRRRIGGFRSHFGNTHTRNGNDHTRNGNALCRLGGQAASSSAMASSGDASSSSAASNASSYGSSDSGDSGSPAA